MLIHLGVEFFYVVNSIVMPLSVDSLGEWMTGELISGHMTS